MNQADDISGRVVREIRARQVASLAGLVVLTLAMASFVNLPGRTLVLHMLGSEVSYEFTGAAQYALLMVGIVCAGMVAIVRAGRPRYASLVRAAAFWGMPLQIALTGLFLLDSLSWWGYQVGLAVLVGLVLAVAIRLQMRSAEDHASAARLALNAMTYALALIAFVAIYALRLRSILSATALLATSALLGAELFRDTSASASAVWWWSILVGGVLSEMTWALNYTRLNTRSGAVFLFTAFYVLTGLIQQHLWQRLNRRAVGEFLISLAIGVVVAAALA